MHALLGYFALFAACFAEGDIAVITAAFAAHQGFLSIWLVFPVAVLATQCADWTWFLLGRKKGQKVLNSKPRLKAKTDNVYKYLDRYQTAMLLGYRFLYGFRSVTLLVVGMGNIKTSKFFFYSAIGTVNWAVVVTALGYFFGYFLESNFSKLKHYEEEVLAAMIAIGIVVFIVRRVLIK